MTIRYVGSLATNSSWGCFTKLLFKWRGSVYKLVWGEYLVFIALYYVIFFVYRYCLNDEQQRMFEKISHYCEASKGPVEMSFVLGFFVTTIVKNWWNLYQTIPWPDSIAHYVAICIPGNDDSVKLLRRTVLRYCNLTLALTFQTISPAFRKRYPSLPSLVKKGLLLDCEMQALKTLGAKSNHGVEWVPTSWATDLVENAKRKETRILEELNKFRKSCSNLLDYENRSVPLVYVQVVTISVYTYFLLCLVDRQWLIRDEKFENLNLYFPFFTTLQFIFHMGWFKVAESIINPFGSDDDDFELDAMLQRHMEISQLMLETKEDYNLRSISHFTKASKLEFPDDTQAICCNNGLSKSSKMTPDIADVLMAMGINNCSKNLDCNELSENGKLRGIRSRSESLESCFSNCYDDDKV